MAIKQAQRASPDALLALAKKEGRGKLKIFLGAAPGVGKTYAMLMAARVAKAEGRDVVIGLLETHGRIETETLLQGLEVLARKPIVYRNLVMKEFDLDAALARHPDLLLVDEYAHTNVAGTRHPKRWQDIEELLAAGIEVWTTLNVQHLESLNDVIQKITRVRVRETIPDRVFEEADEIVLVDLPPDELLKRLSEGKVYVPDAAARAIENFFKPQNLTALRELALRRAAERIDADLVERMQAQAIEGPWPAGERILASVGPDPTSPAIVRQAKRLADLMNAPWLAVAVERPGHQLSVADRQRIDEALKLAETLGAETKTVVGNDLPGELLRLARFENVTQIVVGRSGGGLFAEIFRRSLPHELVRRAEDIAVHVVTGREPTIRELRRRLRLPIGPVREVMPYVLSTFAVAIAVGIGEVLTRLTPLPNLSMVFLMAVLFPAVIFGIWPAIYASLLSFLAYNFFFIEPIYTFTVAEPYELFALFIFLVVAVIASALAGRVRDQGRISEARMRSTRRLYEFTRKLSALARLDDVAEGAAGEISSTLGRPALILLDEAGALALRAAWPPEDVLDAATITAARWAFTHDEPAGADTATLPTVPWFFIPLRTPRGRIGVAGVARTETLGPLDSDARALLDALADQTAAALDRAALAREMLSARTAAATERVRNTLLASISHDFRTPLSSILGSATSLLDYPDKLDPAARRDLLGHIKTEAEDLDDMVRNLLVITRIEEGALELRLDWVDLREIADRAISTARRRGASQHFETRLPSDLPLVRADASLAEQTLGNIVNNAVAHTPAETRVIIDAELEERRVKLRVTDDGPGIPADVLPNVFEKFVRGRPGSTSADGGQGTGLGLAIAKGIMEAHGGSIAAESPVANGRGTRIVLTFPRADSA
jgi:two-component system sensor histidine kinase KdpD